MTKKGMAFETLGKWLIALAILVLLVIGIATQKDKLFSLLQKMAEMLRFR